MKFWFVKLVKQLQLGDLCTVQMQFVHKFVCGDLLPIIESYTSELRGIQVARLRKSTETNFSECHGLWVHKSEIMVSDFFNAKIKVFDAKSHHFLRELLVKTSSGEWRL